MQFLKTENALQNDKQPLYIIKEYKYRKVGIIQVRVRGNLTS